MLRAIPSLLLHCSALNGASINDVGQQLRVMRNHILATCELIAVSSIVHGKLENQVVHYHTTMLRACVVMSHDISAVLPILRVRIIILY